MDTVPNHFAILSKKENLSAFFIQSAWRSHRIRKFKREMEKKFEIGVKAFVTSLTYDAIAVTNIDRVKHIFDVHKIDYELIDIVEDKTEWNKIKKPDTPIPYVVIHGLRVGSYDKLQELEDAELLEPIFRREYLRRCLYCKDTRKDLKKTTCSSCWKDYLFFLKEIH